MIDARGNVENILVGTVALGDAVAAGDCRELGGDQGCVIEGLRPGPYTVWGSTIEVDSITVAGQLVLVRGAAPIFDQAMLDEGDPEPMKHVWTWGPLAIVDRAISAHLSEASRFPFGHPPPISSSDEIGVVDSPAQFALITHAGQPVGAAVVPDYVDTQYDVFLWGDEQGDPFAVGYMFHDAFLPGTSAFRG